MRRRFGRSDGTEDAVLGSSHARTRGAVRVEEDNHEAVVTSYTKELQRRAKRADATDAVWNWRCSVSILGAILIWLLIGLFVLHMIDSTQGGTLQKAAGRVNHGDVSEHSLTSPPELASASSVRAQLPAGCLGDHCRMEGGTEEFGSILGTHNGVFAFSNCFHSTCISMLEHKIDVPITEAAAEQLLYMADSQNVESDVIQKGKQWLRSLSSGMKWQCVEYARRYWMLAGTPEPAFFGDIDGAADIWDLSEAYLVDGTVTPLLKYANGVASGRGGSPPRAGDLVIYDRHGESVPYGHVAVVVGVERPPEASGRTSERGVVYLAEQNWHNVLWPGPYHNYSRYVPLRVDIDAAGRGTYTMEDPFVPIKGWVRYGLA